ncbi:MAG: hypothetical protein K9G67_13775 [Bacteroidales bacterium]|nr:hypothetical protein [Bacteroidales bacterium]MCF8352441.1 hypothetical protein [Bacteroidales bacterium]MCF8377421.1 hypothetical protein [Bacteroidales bacterium]MCF8401633.1 hypothetical protein [Bacteroidales bacterium]
MNKVKTFLKENISWLAIAGLAIGATGGYLYYYFIGCNSGSCAITSNPYMSILWGALLGYLVFDMFKPKTKSRKDQSEENPA